MKTTYKTVLGLMLLLFVGCGGGSSNTTETSEQNVPKSPVVSEKEKIPPAIPDI